MLFINNLFVFVLLTKLQISFVLLVEIQKIVLLTNEGFSANIFDLMLLRNFYFYFVLLVNSKKNSAAN